MGAIQAALSSLHDDIQKETQAAGRKAQDVTLVAVSKKQPQQRIDAALQAGQRIFGENRVQEAVEHWEERRKAYPDVQLHLIGPLQTNKVKQAVTLFDVIETLDRPKLAEALVAEFKRQNKSCELFIQVNTGAEEQKAGILPGDADDFISFCRDDLDLPVKGLMCIPPIDDPPSLHFALLADIAKRNNLVQLSMGMSADYDKAIRFGATHIRVGTALFGERD